MATLHANPLPPPDAPDDLRCHRVAEDRQRLALAVLLTGKANPQSPAVGQFLDFARTQRLDLRELWVAELDQTIRAAALVVPNPGRTGMTFVSPARHTDVDPALARLVHTIAAAQDSEHVRLLQILLDTTQFAEHRSALAGGFEDLATLAYMHRPADLPRTTLDLRARGLSFVHWEETHRPLFARAILASYEQTLDCPGLLGLRDIDDIITGHMATGQFDPQLWYAFYDGDTPVGVMLLGVLPPHRSGELIYLGLAPDYRGKGLAQPILTHGLGELSARDTTRLLLAVDEANAPAIRLYRQAKFRTSARKAALIRPVPPR